jgi:hypothetical protein
MITDDSKGEATGEAWSRERWTEVMKPFYDKPMKDMKITHKPTVFLLSDSLASVDDVSTMTMGGKTITSRNSMFVVRRDGKWLVKAMAEGGWGDMMAQMPSATAGGAQESGSQGTGSAAEAPGAQGTGSAAPEPQGAGSAAEPPGSQGTGSAAEAPGSQGTGSAAPEPQGAGSAAEPPPGSQGTGSGGHDAGSHGTGSGAPGGTESTTK